MQFTPEIESMIAAAVAKGGVSQEDNAAITRAALIAGIDPNDVANEVNARIVAAQQTAEAERKAAQEKAEAEEAARLEARRKQSGKHGEVHKCPRCGEVVPAAAVRCEACGYEFVGVQAVNSSREFAEGIAKLQQEGRTIDEKNNNAIWEHRKRIDSFIINFPIPSTREDLLEFIAGMAARIEGSHGDSYLMKLKECLTKAEILFPGDPMFQPLIEKYSKEIKSKEQEPVRVMLYIWGSLFAIIILGCIMSLLS